MGYVEQSLGAHETVHYSARFPTVRYFIAWLVIAAGLAAGLVCFMSNEPLIGIAIVLFGLAAFCSILYQPWTTEIAVTNHRLIYKRGFFQRQTNDLQLKAIEEVQLHQGFLGRLFNYGDVEFHGTGVDDLQLPTIASPISFQRAAQEAIGAHQEETEMPVHPQRPIPRAS